MEMESTFVEIYKEVYSKRVKRFPLNFWKSDGVLNYLAAKEITIYLIEIVLDWNEDSVKKNLCGKTFRNNFLGGMLDIVFGGNIYKAIDNAYPGKFHEWDFSYVSRNYWNKETAKEATIWLIEKLGWGEEEIRNKLNQKVFCENGLAGMLNKVFRSSPYEAIENAYPGKFHEWEFSSTPNRYWNKETAKEATIWLVEKLGYNEEQIKQRLNVETFKENGLLGMLNIVFKGSPYRAIENAYPGRFHEWDFSCVSRNYWNKETAKEAMKWLIEKLGWREEEIRKNLNQKVFFDNGLLGMLNIVFGGSPYKAIESVYPGKFHEWELSSTPNNYWNKETAKEATIWLVEKLGYNEEQIKQRLNVETFKENGLLGMLNIVFKGSPYRAIENAYPDIFERK